MPNGKFDRAAILNITLVCEAGLLLVATCWCFLAQINLAAAMEPKLRNMVIGIVAGIVTAGSGFFLLFFANTFKTGWLAKLREIVYKDVAPLCEQLELLDILLIAASSGICEEIFFRGVLQHAVGLLPASIMFGLVHCPSRAVLPYGFWTFIAGLFLGWLYLWTGSLWAPILAHAVSNLIVLIYFRYKK